MGEVPQHPARIGPYQIVRRLGAGGMGVVYLGHNEVGEQAAVKLIRPEFVADPVFRARLRREVDAARRVPRSCTAPLLAADLEAATPWVATEYIDGPSLDVVLVERGRLSGPELAGLAVGVAVALRAIHAHGVIHRDLKPTNILLSQDGPRVIDFGIARVKDAASQLTQLTQTGAVVGTPAYLAPEQLGDAPLTPAVDIFAWGCVVARAATGRLPFGTAGVFQVPQPDQPEIGEVPGVLRALVAAALAPDPAARPSAAELVDMLSESAGETTARVFSAAADGAQPAITPSLHSAPTHVPGAVPAGVPAAQTRPWRRRALGGAAAAVVVTLAAVGVIGALRGDDPAGGDNGSGAGPAADGPLAGVDFDPDAALTFGVSRLPESLDPTFWNPESGLVANHIFDTLLRVRPGTIEIEPALATSWEPDRSGTVWTFELREDVRFHDGTSLDAGAVCANFDRWHRLSGQAQQRSDDWRRLFGGFAENDPELDLEEPGYASCEPAGRDTAVVTLTRPTSKFPAMLVLPSFAIHSPAALAAHNASRFTSEEPGAGRPAYGHHPTGTGPMRLASITDEAITLSRNDDYWGESATIRELVFRAYPGEEDIRSALLTGDIDGYDRPPPSRWSSLTDAGMNVMVRGPADLLYLGFTHDSHEALTDLRVRQAIAHALDRPAAVAQLPEGSVVASQFQLASLPGWNPEVAEYAHDPQRARELLAAAGYGEGELRLDFYWPTEVSRPYLPEPGALFALLQHDLQEAGISVNEFAMPWSTYLSAVGSGEADLYLLGWHGEYPDASDFLGTWFAGPDPQWGYRHPQLWEAMAAADRTAESDQRHLAYQQLNQTVMEFLPGIPIAEVPTAIVMAPGIDGVVANPLGGERLHTARMGN